MLVEIPPRMSYWLVPAEPHLLNFQQRVSQYAKQFGGPDFVPHATIYFGAYDANDDVESILCTLQRFGKLELKPKSILFTEKYTQSCFIQFEESTVLSEMCDVVRRCVRKPDSYSVAPHLSLFYGALSPEQRTFISGDFALPDCVVFDCMYAIANPPQVACREDVEFWYEVSRLRLA